MPEEIKTAEEVVASVATHRRKQKKEKRQYDAARAKEQATLEAYEDLRDDVITLVMNNKMTFEDIHGRCGPHPSTLTSWMTGKVQRPQLAKVQSVLRILGYDLGVVEGRRKRLKEWQIALASVEPPVSSEPQSQSDFPLDKEGEPFPPDKA